MGTLKGRLRCWCLRRTWPTLGFLNRNGKSATWQSVSDTLCHVVKEGFGAKCIMYMNPLAVTPTIGREILDWSFLAKRQYRRLGKISIFSTTVYIYRNIHIDGYNITE